VPIRSLCHKTHNIWNLFNQKPNVVGGDSTKKLIAIGLVLLLVGTIMCVSAQPNPKPFDRAYPSPVGQQYGPSSVNLPDTPKPGQSGNHAPGYVDTPGGPE
jgi:hypothetical protein